MPAHERLAALSQQTAAPMAGQQPSLCVACSGASSAEASLPAAIGSADQPELTAGAAELRRMLAVIEDEIIPKTRVGVAEGNKVFGAAVLDSRLATIVADTNHEMESPLFHGEVYVLNRWAAETPAAERGSSAANAIFLSTHEPCCMCISSLVWAGFTKVFYFFPYEATTSQGIPYDVEIIHELWRVPTYAKRNKYCAAAPVQELIEALPDGEEKAALVAQSLVRAHAQLPAGAGSGAGAGAGTRAGQIDLQGCS